MTDFWTRFNEMAAAAELTDTGKLFADSNFHVGHNGGGTSAWERQVGETGWKVLMTDIGGCDHVSEDGTWIVGAHNDNGDYVDRCVEAATVAEALAAADAFDLALGGHVVTPAATIGEKIILAREFGSKVQEELSRADFRSVLELNRNDSAACHTHDFCDANMLMLEAFKVTFERDPVFLTNPEDVADLALWNDAWQIAKAAEFFA
jgi:hypothetical protein